MTKKNNDLKTENETKSAIIETMKEQMKNGGKGKSKKERQKQKEKFLKKITH